MKIFKSGEVIKASDINSNFSKAIKTDLSNCPVIPCNKGGTGRTDCSIAYADKAGIASLAEVATIAKGLQLEQGSESIGLVDLSNIIYDSGFTIKYHSSDKQYYKWQALLYAPDYGNKWLCLSTTNIGTSHGELSNGSDLYFWVKFVRIIVPLWFKIASPGELVMSHVNNVYGLMQYPPSSFSKSVIFIAIK